MYFITIKGWCLYSQPSACTTNEYYPLSRLKAHLHSQFLIGTLVAIDIIGIFNLEKKSFFLIPVYRTHPQFDIILPEKMCALYMGKNGIVLSDGVNTMGT